MGNKAATTTASGSAAAFASHCRRLLQILVTLELLRRDPVFRHNSIPITADNRRLADDGIGRIEPLLTQRVEPPCSIGTDLRTRNACHASRSRIRTSTRREPEMSQKWYLECSTDRCQPRARCKAEATTAPEKGCAGCAVGVASDHDELVIRAHGLLQPLEKPVFRNRRSCYVAGTVRKCGPHPWPRLSLPPPVAAMEVAVGVFADRLHILMDMLKRRFRQGRFFFAHLPAKIDDPRVGTAPTYIHAVDPWPEHLRIGPPVR